MRRKPQERREACLYFGKDKYGNRRLVDGSSPHVPCLSASLFFLSNVHSPLLFPESIHGTLKRDEQVPLLIPLTRIQESMLRATQCSSLGPGKLELMNNRQEHLRELSFFTMFAFHVGSFSCCYRTNRKGKKK